MGVQVWTEPDETRGPCIVVGVVVPGQQPKGVVAWTGPDREQTTMAEFHRALDVCYVLAAFLNSCGDPVQLRHIVETVVMSVQDALSGLTTLLDYEPPSKRSYSMMDETTVFHVMPARTLATPAMPPGQPDQ